MKLTLSVSLAVRRDRPRELDSAVANHSSMTKSTPVDVCPLTRMVGLPVVPHAHS